MLLIISQPKIIIRFTKIVQSLLNFDLKHILHPCSQMKDYEWLHPLIIDSASGVYFHTRDGRKVIDAISSWWCKSFGHQHPRLQAALLQQAKRFEHVIFANTTNDIIVELTQKLVQLMPHLSHVFYAGDGSCAVEVAMKMSLHTRYVQGERHKSQFIALANGYHGETLGALSVSDLAQFKVPYQSALFDVYFIEPPYVTGMDDPLWQDCNDDWPLIEAQLLQRVDTTTAILVEPIVQGAGGMRIYSADFLNRLAKFAKHHGIHLIADEIMTGMGRTGRMLASEWATIQPDIICLSKGLTGGWLPFSAVLFTDEINQYFYGDMASGKSFLHSHTYSGNVLGAAVANAVLDLLQDDACLRRINAVGEKMRKFLEDIANETGRLQQVRQIGAIAAAELVVHPDAVRPGYQVFQRALELGAFLRPLGSTIYWLPPYIIDDDTLSHLHAITKTALNNV